MRRPHLPHRRPPPCRWGFTVSERLARPRRPCGHRAVRKSRCCADAGEDCHLDLRIDGGALCSHDRRRGHKHPLRERNATREHLFQARDSDCEPFACHFMPPTPDEGCNVVFHPGVTLRRIRPERPENILSGGTCPASPRSSASRSRITTVEGRGQSASHVRA